MPQHFRVNYEWDVVAIRKEVREFAREIGFDELDQTRIVQSVSELARNIVHHADEGTISIEKIEQEGKYGLQIRVQDCGPGIGDIEELMRKILSPINMEASGLLHVKELMDNFIIREEGEGTIVEVVKWLEMTSTATDA
ncbi:ATP-binding protein [Mechercharimyces sp. CAU 1602]|uniref:ATP-binding protein n=1 Tax=Mechercharimyces sp. CAU 1602 TaxID=2973933 RepID=UPI0021632D18|nr:ATP-binding protein [Mechercharimyces sp. CAU 1602]MCS1352753.1 ATP-binding protein [Mechercharimyces sp. CAU 1602]